MENGGVKTMKKDSIELLAGLITFIILESVIVLIGFVSIHYVLTQPLLSSTLSIQIILILGALGLCLFSAINFYCNIIQHKYSPRIKWEK